MDAADISTSKPYVANLKKRTSIVKIDRTPRLDLSQCCLKQYRNIFCMVCQKLNEEFNREKINTIERNKHDKATKFFAAAICSCCYRAYFSAVWKFADYSK